MRHLFATFAVALLVGGLAACGATRPSKYYQLQVPAGPSRSGGADAYSASLLVGRLAAPHLYRDDRIVYRTGPEQLDSYEYHRWAEPPTEMLEAILLRMLRESGRYRSVQLLRSNAHGDYILRGRLFNFEEVSGSPLAARVALEIELYDVKSGTTAWSQFYSRDEPVNGKDVSAVVQALNRNVQQGLAQITAGIEQYFASHPTK